MRGIWKRWYPLEGIPQKLVIDSFTDDERWIDVLEILPWISPRIKVYKVNMDAKSSNE
ncbi:hypothetical protein [Oceanirhabdus sp. W0125-5]|uniref:hypothetical protein n=1 Tax=Oceanirhabdus sp. W0125-5 TaxID=2999116 RepID=UPI0022F2AFBD|nr:hypothetical protein [Oceanirhabdus sp. W0125-5]WBW95237.1 hypothetical protein OW730_16260 [Oceanirhabdus sp. W0125-5]